MSKTFTEAEVKNLILATARFITKSLTGKTTMERPDGCYDHQEQHLTKKIVGVVKTQLEAVLDEKKAAQAGSILSQLIFRMSDDYSDNVGVQVKQFVSGVLVSKGYTQECKMLIDSFEK